VANRRRFLQSLSGLSLLSLPASAGKAFGAPVKRDYFSEMKISRFINAGEPYTTLSGSPMLPEVVRAMEYAASQSVRLNDVHDAVAARIASLIGCEAAMVTAGAASALGLGTAACMTGTNRQFVRALPDTTGMKTEVIIQKSHRYGYDHAVRNCGTRFVEVETRDELERAITDRTVMMLFYNRHDSIGQIKAAEFVALGKKHAIPVFNDCAGDVPPAENLSHFSKMGFDLVTVSGGKGLRGPQSTGLLLGRKDLILAARLNGPPNSDAIGRGMKVNKEEMLGLMVAVEAALKPDHAADWREWEKRTKLIADSLASLKPVKTEMFVPEITYRTPHLRIRWDETALKIAPPELVRQLRDGQPSIEVRSSPNDCVEIGVWLLHPGEAQTVARRIREILRSAA
jgi:D-glucosaminate-6-phosphate ammonia-lyase